MDDKQCCGYNKNQERCVEEGTKSVRATRGGGESFGGFVELRVSHLLWFCDEHYRCQMSGPASWEDEGWKVDY